MHIFTTCRAQTSFVYIVRNKPQASSMKAAYLFGGESDLISVWAGREESGPIQKCSHVRCRQGRASVSVSAFAARQHSTYVICKYMSLFVFPCFASPPGFLIRLIISPLVMAFKK